MSPICPKSQYDQNVNVPNIPNVLMNVPNFPKSPKSLLLTASNLPNILINISNIYTSTSSIWLYSAQYKPVLCPISQYPNMIWISSKLQARCLEITLLFILWIESCLWKHKWLLSFIPGQENAIRYWEVENNLECKKRFLEFDILLQSQAQKN